MTCKIGVNALKSCLLACCRWTHKGLEHEGGSNSSSALHEEDSDEEAEEEAFPAASEGCTSAEAAAPGFHVSAGDVDRIVDTWRRCSILVGMHPDQARFRIQI